MHVSARSPTPYSSTTFKKNHTDAGILKSQIWLERRIADNLLMEQAAEEFGLNMRNFNRRFKERVALSPSGYRKRFGNVRQ